MFKKKIYKPGQGNRGSGSVGGANAIIEKNKDVKKAESRIPVPGKGQASPSPISEDGNDKELLNRICQLHQQIRADHTPAKDIDSAIGKLKTEIQNLISELDDSEENTEEQKKPAKSKPVDRKATESGTNKSKDLYTVATTTKMKLNSNLVKTRKELKEISELAVAIGQEVGFQPETSRADRDKDSLSVNAKGALEDIKRMNKELSEKLNKLSKNIEGYSTNQTEQQRNDQKPQPNRPYQKSEPSKPPKKKKEQSEEKKDHKSSQFDTNLEIISKAVSSFDDLQQYKGELKEISELAVAVGQEVGFQPETSRADRDKDSLSFNAKGALEDIKRMNKELSEKLNKLSKNIEGYSTNQTEQQRNDQKPQPNRPYQKPEPSKPPKKKKEQSEEKKDHKSSQFDTNFEIISKAVSSFDDLQQYKGKMDHLAKRTIELAMKEGDRPIQDNTLLSELERAIGDIEGDIKKLRHLETKNRDEIQKLKREIEIKVTEKEALHNRLSKLAGNKMTAGNPNIANLGDPNRPTKIAEIYSEIYDNEWTDTLDFCLKKLGKEYSEDEALQALNKTLIICYKICQEKSDEWIQKTKEKLQHCLRELMVDIQSDEILMPIKEGRKVVSDQMSQKLLKEIRPKKDLGATKYATEMNSSKLYKMIIQNKFFEKCFTLCWKMIVQNPRMILVEGPATGNTYDRNIFREFTKSGSKVVFTVWPALYLHEGGPLLVKGVLKVE